MMRDRVAQRTDIGRNNSLYQIRSTSSDSAPRLGKTVGLSHLYHLEKARARRLLFAPAFAKDLQRAAAKRGDTELIDFERLYNGS